MLEISPKGTVPVLQLADGQVIDESLDVMKWAFSQDRNLENGTPKGWPNDDLWTLISKIDGPFKFNLDRYKYENRYEAEGAVAAEHRDANLATLEELDRILSKSPWLEGAEMGFTDMAIAPFIRQFANTDRQWFDQTGYSHLIDWLDRFCESADFQSIMKKLKPWIETNQDIYFPFK